ncbi:MAG: hypothetical protein ACRDDZ_13780 [Marinifilaceae bacterium]
MIKDIEYMWCKKYIVLISGLFFYSCTSNLTKEDDVPLAKVYDSYLLKSEVTELLPKGISTEDSLIMSRNFIKNWVTKQLLLQKATENLSGEERRIQQQVEEYRTSLLIHNYKQKMIEQRLMEQIPQEDIELYYNTNKYNFTLPTSICKAVYFVLPNNAPNIKKVERLFKSDKAEDLNELEAYCITNGKKYDNFDDKWVEAKYLINLLPLDLAINERQIIAKGSIQCEDSENIYFLKLYDVYKELSVAPLEYVSDEITLILKNKKKLQFENELEREINKEANTKNYVKLY